MTIRSLREPTKPCSCILKVQKVCFLKIWASLIVLVAELPGVFWLTDARYAVSIWRDEILYYLGDAFLIKEPNSYGDFSELFFL